MKKCESCDYLNEGKNTFCSECGASLSNQASRSVHRSEVDSRKNRLTRKKTPIVLALIAILLIGLFTGYQMLSKKYSEEAVIEQFKAALEKKDKETLKELIVPTDSRLKVNNQSLGALFRLIDKEPSLMRDIENSLRNEELGNQLFYLHEDGKHYGIFARHVVDTPGYFITLSSTGKGTIVYLNDSEIGVLNVAEKTQEFGPFLVGTYTIKGMNKTGDKNSEDEVTVKLAGTKTETAVTLNTGVPEKVEEKEEGKEKTVVKEVIREVRPTPSYSYYLIPNSDYSYLSYSDLSSFSKSELRLARNEIFARHGYIFKSKDLQNYFYSQAWYSPNPGYKGNLSPVEKYNVDMIKSLE